MQFKNPELLYCLLLLVIPVIVHLFQLRRFKTEPFTNVKFLKQAVRETRKSARIKKVLILFTRLLLLSCLVIAFAQPFLPSDTDQEKNQEIIIYLDNSLSMQAKGKKGVLLKQGIQQLLESLPADKEISVFTNDEEFLNLNLSTLREKLQQVSYSAKQLDWNTIRLKVDQISSGPGSFIAISDFQQHNVLDSLLPVKEMNNYIIPMSRESINNISLDSLYISSTSPEETVITGLVSTTGRTSQEITLSVYDDPKLLLRKTLPAGVDSTLKVTFSLPAGPVENGRVSVGDNGPEFDNELFFSINLPDAVKVIAIGNQKTNFLERIYTKPEFDFTSFPENNVDFSQLSAANVVILNEPQHISVPLVNELQKMLKEKVIIAVIPSAEADLEAYNRLLRSLDMPVLSAKMERERLITAISFSHPLYSSVFDEEVKNFQFPMVQTYYRTSQTGRPVLQYNNGESFLMEKDGVYLFSAPVNTENSNFQGSPLIVPTFFSMGNLAVSLNRLYYSLGEEQTISLPVNLRKDKILTLVSGELSFIPRQQVYQNKVQLFLEGDLNKAGHFKVMEDQEILTTLAFNYSRSESNTSYRDLLPSKNFFVQQDIPYVFNEIQTAGEVTALWKWFAIFALVFLINEMLILKYFK